jgi:hypothetical protein
MMGPSQEQFHYPAFSRGETKTMDRRIRNIDERAFGALKAKAAAEGKTIDEAFNEAIRAYTATRLPFPKTGSLFDMRPTKFPKGNERLSEQVDEVVYGL